jgi:hypothetical protein
MNRSGKLRRTRAFAPQLARYGIVDGHAESIPVPYTLCPYIENLDLGLDGP